MWNCLHINYEEVPQVKEVASKELGMQTLNKMFAQ